MEDNNQNPIQEFGTKNTETEVIEKKEENTQEQTTQTVETNQDGKVKSQTMNSYALASFICSLVGLAVCGLPLGIAAIITAVRAKSTFKPEIENNKWMATFGLVLGIIDIVCVCFFMFAIYNTGTYSRLY